MDGQCQQGQREPTSGESFCSQVNAPRLQHIAAKNFAPASAVWLTSCMQQCNCWMQEAADVVLHMPCAVEQLQPSRNLMATQLHLMSSCPLHTAGGCLLHVCLSTVMCRHVIVKVVHAIPRKTACLPKEACVYDPVEAAADEEAA